MVVANAKVHPSQQQNTGTSEQIKTTDLDQIVTSEGMLMMGPNSRKNVRKRLHKFDHTEKLNANIHKEDGKDRHEAEGKKARPSKRVKFQENADEGALQPIV